jgi:hypothetical protein
VKTSKMNSFSELIEDLQSNLHHNLDSINSISYKSPSSLFKKLNELAAFTGSRHGLRLQLHFPDPRKIKDVESIGTENIGIVVDSLRKKFPIPREDIKQKAFALLGANIQAQDAYMYEGKEGIRIIKENGTIEILPGSILLWCKLDERVKDFGDWLMCHVYYAPSAGIIS